MHLPINPKSRSYTSNSGSIPLNVSHCDFFKESNHDIHHWYCPPFVRYPASFSTIFCSSSTSSSNDGLIMPGLSSAAGIRFPSTLTSNWIPPSGSHKSSPLHSLYHMWTLPFSFLSNLKRWAFRWSCSCGTCGFNQLAISYTQLTIETTGGGENDNRIACCKSEIWRSNYKQNILNLICTVLSHLEERERSCVSILLIPLRRLDQYLHVYDPQEEIQSWPSTKFLRVSYRLMGMLLQLIYVCNCPRLY